MSSITSVFGDDTATATADAPAKQATFIRRRPIQATMQDPAATDDKYFTAPGDLQLVPDPSRRQDVTFDGPLGERIAGHVYAPTTGAAPYPAIVLCGPISAVKEQVVPNYAERLADAGYLCVTFDPRGFGGSEGPRGLHQPERTTADFASAVRYAFTRSDVDTDEISAVGVCMGGGYAVSLGAFEKRLRAIVAVAGGYDIGGTFTKLMGVKGFAGYQQTISEAVDAAKQGKSDGRVPTVKADGLDEDTPIAVMPNAEAASFYLRTQDSYAPAWSNEFDVASLEPYLAYKSIATAAAVAPTPLMFIHGTTDLFLLPEFAEQAYEAYPAAEGSKEFVWIETHNHIELYDQDPYVSTAVQHITRWIDEAKAAAEKAAEDDGDDA